MKPLQGHVVTALPGAESRALARLLETFGADVQPCTLEALGRALTTASILVETMGLEQLASAGWDRRKLRATNPRLIHVSVTSFGSGGPRAHWRGGELIASAMGGVLRLTGTRIGRPSRKPSMPAGFMRTWWLPRAHWPRTTSAERAGAASSSMFPCRKWRFRGSVNSVLVWQFDRRKLSRVGGALNYGLATVRCIWPLADGWCFHTLMTGRFGAPANRALSDWIDEEGMHESPARRRLDVLQPLDTGGADRACGSMQSRHFSAHARSRISPQEGHRRGNHATVIAEPADVLADTHLRSATSGSSGGDPNQGGSCSSTRVRLQRAMRRQRGQLRCCEVAPTGTDGRSARARFFLGARGLHNHQDTRRPGRRCNQGRKPHATLPVAHRRSGQRFSSRQF